MKPTFISSKERKRNYREHKRLRVLEQLYRPTKESLKFGEYDLKSITYRFSDDLLASVILTTKGYTNDIGILKMLQETYGEGEPEKFTRGLKWIGEKVSMLFYLTIGNGARIIILSNKFRVKQIIKLMPIDSSKIYL